MYNEILVPIDGSQLAEKALPHASAVARAFGAHLTVLYVVEPITVYPYPGTVDSLAGLPIDMASERERAVEYLDHIVKRLTIEGSSADMAVIEGDPASEICDFATHHNVDMIVMSTHGRSGLGRWVYGSVAERVLRSATIPILLIRAHEE